MNGPTQSKAASAGGCFIAGLVPVGAVVGGLLGQPSIGLLVGLGLGIAIAVGIWLRERGR